MIEPGDAGISGYRSRDLAELARPPRPSVAATIADTGWDRPGAPDVRVLVFGDGGTVVVVEVRRHATGLVAEGFVRPLPGARATARPRRKSHVAAAALDEGGRFTLPLVPPGPFSVVVTFDDPGRPGVATEWVTV